jgi:hypothetical protein
MLKLKTHSGFHDLGFGLGQAQNCGEVKLVNVMSPSPSSGQSEINE